MENMSYCKGFRLNDKTIYDLSTEDVKIMDAAIYQWENRTSIVDTAKNFNFSKSTWHNRIHNELKALSTELYDCLDSVLKSHLKRAYYSRKEQINESEQEHT